MALQISQSLHYRGTSDQVHLVSLTSPREVGFVILPSQG